MQRTEIATQRAKFQSRSNATSLRFLSLLLATVVLGAAATTCTASVSLTGANPTYSQDFDTLTTSAASTPWSNDSTLPGWFLYRQPAPGTAITSYTGGTGSSSSGSFYSFGAAGSSDRALGGVGSGGAYFGSPASAAVAGWWAVSLTNTTNSSIDSFTVNFDGEQWRDGGNATMASQSMVMQYAFGSDFTSVPAANWTAAGSAFNFTSVHNTTTAAAIDGNSNHATGLGGTISGLSWNNGDTLWIRWVETNDTGNDHGLAVDNFSFSATTLSSSVKSLIWQPGATANWNTTEQNWRDSGDVSKYADGNAVVFDDSGVALQNGSVVIDAAGVKPNSTTVSHNSGTYTFSGGPIGGASALNKTGTGTLVLTSNNTYTGGTKINGGVIEFTADSQLGDPNGAISFGGGTLKSDLVAAGSNLQLAATRAVTGGAATIDVAPSTTLTVQGNFTVSGPLTLPNSGTVALAGANRSTGGIIFTTTGRVKVGASASDFLSVSGDINANDGAGTATIDGSLDFGTSAHTITVAGTGKLVITGGLKDSAAVTIRGTGTVDAQGDNSGLSGQSVDLGTTPDIGHAGATFVVHDSNSLGKGTMFFNSGALMAVPTVPGTAIEFGGSLLQSVGAAGDASSAAIYEGGDLIFDGSVRLFKNGTAPAHFVVNNTTSFNGGWAASAGSGAVLNVIFSGTGTLNLAGNLAAQTLPMTIDTLTVNLNGNLSGAANNITVVNGGKLTLGVSSALAPAATLTLGESLNNTAGTLATGGNSQATGLLTVAGTGHSTIDLGGGVGPSTLGFANSNNGSWTVGTSLQIKNWSAGTTHLVFGTDSTGLSSDQLSSIQFADFAHAGASILAASTEAGFAAGEVVPRQGDIDQNGIVNSADFNSLMQALVSVPAYKGLLSAQSASLTDSDENFILDVNLDGTVDNADLQAEIFLVANSPIGGAPSPTTVPEPSAFLLGALGTVMFVLRMRRRARQV